MKSFQELVEGVLLARGDEAYKFCRDFDVQLANERRVSRLTNINIFELKQNLNA